MTDRMPEQEDLSGALLISHPALQDPSFCKSVVLVSSHSEEDGALGIIINRPLGQMLAEVNDEFAHGPLAEVEVYEGGPVQNEQLLLAAWHWMPENATFRLYFGIPKEKAIALMEQNSGVIVRAFLGYAGWSQGQLESERKEGAWVISVIDGKLMELNGDDMWRAFLGSISPELALLANAPDNPEVN